ncbi:Ubiquitin-conjugating_enzyme E2 [Hexamita inflata]|uniref:Ubiquitin-conjugating enzyme E2 n=1 Tax=Hexamita inflata TaxID=28002 RepID=A0AA86R0L6_9EUKA|nr:Ubiquitin-conjugating enzyme E2 [Hexamita inflata]
MTNVDQTRMKILAKQFGDMKKSPNMVAFFPDKMNPFNWHISFKGPVDSNFQGGIYHCQLKLTNYPDKPPEIRIMNESGAYHVNEPLCIHGLSANNPQDWTPGTQISTIIEALSMYMNLRTDRGGMGFIQKLDQEVIKECRDASVRFKCACGADHSTLFK